jgi:Ser/Thr protein kinase RdoA (MazF antagonist)
VITAEELVDGGEYVEGTSETAHLFAAPLARLVSDCTSYHILGTLLPAPPWLGWNHGGAGIWPAPDDLDVDLNDYTHPHLDSIAERVGRLLCDSPLPPVIGHADWHPGNLRWDGNRLAVAYDWDSLALLPEAAIAGGASVLYTQNSRAAASAEESAAFLDAYARARGQVWSAEEAQVFWAAGLWNLAFDAKKQTLDGIGGSLAALERGADRRLELAGL